MSKLIQIIFRFYFFENNIKIIVIKFNYQMNVLFYFIIIIISKQKMISILTFIILIIKIIHSQNTFQVSLSYPLLLTSNQEKINYMANNFDKKTYVAFDANYIRVYSEDFKSYYTFNVPQPVQYIIFRNTRLNGFLKNLTTNVNIQPSIIFNDSKIILRSKNSTQIRILNYATNVQQDSFTLLEKIIQSNIAYSYINGSRSVNIILICNESIKVSNNSQIAIEIRYQTIFGQNLTAVKALCYKTGFSMRNNIITYKILYTISMSNNVLYKLDFRPIYNYSFQSSNFQLISANYTTSIIATPNQPISTMLNSSQLMLMQLNSGNLLVWNFVNQAMANSINIPTDKIFSFFNNNTTNFLLQSKGLYQLSFNTTNNSLIYQFKINSLPQNVYSLNIGKLFSQFYIPGGPNIYKGGYCQGQSLFSNECSAYNCSDMSCSYCSISPSLCSVCDANYALTQNYECQEMIQNNALLNIMQALFQYLKKALQFLISIPGARRVISPFFYYFGVYDDIFLYQYHDRKYGVTMKSFFEQINQIQNKKWSIINYETVLNWIGINKQSFHKRTIYQDSYTYQYKNISPSQYLSESLWSNSQNYFLVSVPIVCIAFVFFKFLFKITYDYKISKIFRNFDLLGYLFLLLFEGNIQQFAFYLVFQWKNMFFFSFSDKIMKTLALLFGFILVIISVSLFFLSYSFYKNVNQYLMDNNKNTLGGQLILTFQFGIRNVYLGFLHSVLRPLGYQFSLLFLLLNQILFFIAFVVALYKKLYKNDIKCWLYLLLDLIKMALLFTLFFDYKMNYPESLENIQFNLIKVFIGFFIIGSIYESYCTLKQLKKMLIFLLTTRINPKDLDQQLPQRAKQRKQNILFLNNKIQSQQKKLKEVQQILNKKLKKKKQIKFIQKNQKIEGIIKKDNASEPVGKNLDKNLDKVNPPQQISNQPPKPNVYKIRAHRSKPKNGLQVINLKQ